MKVTITHTPEQSLLVLKYVHAINATVKSLTVHNSICTTTLYTEDKAVCDLPYDKETQTYTYNMI